MAPRPEPLRDGTPSKDEGEDLMSFDSDDDSDKKKQNVIDEGLQAGSASSKPFKEKLRRSSASASALSAPASDPAPPVKEEPALKPSLRHFRNSPFPQNCPGEADWTNLEEEATRYRNPDWPPVVQCPPPYLPEPNTPIASALTCPVVDPQKELRDKIKFLKEQIRLEKEHQELIAQLKGLKTGKAHENVRREDKFKPGPPIRGATPRVPSGSRVPLELETVEVFPVTETADTQGQAWRHHSGFDFKVIKKFKTATAQYGAITPYTMAILKSVTKN
ncbi:uncharacterized protein LOC110345686 [Heterocephalus glaber]|uniref:Uncharacterized protein LOC110345686 n=1 Tax=Heterocephalus glaber TaxID=10181 RepID=A0AAX6RTJ3_HETGA|nr:uncharacterized protein LOC110345686 [Heterocephalus glaber]